MLRGRKGQPLGAALFVYAANSGGLQARRGGTDTRDMDYLADALLFVRGEQSIRITRASTGKRLLTYGPADAKHSHDFTSAASLEEFLESYQQRLKNDGWVLAIVSERRQSEPAIPPEHERRARERRAKAHDR